MQTTYVLLIHSITPLVSTFSCILNDNGTIPLISQNVCCMIKVEGELVKYMQRENRAGGNSPATPVLAGSVFLKVKME